MDMKTFKTSVLLRFFLNSLFLTAFVCSIAPGAAMAQQEEQQPGMLEEIIVTAQKRVADDGRCADSGIGDYG